MTNIVRLRSDIDRLGDRRARDAYRERAFYASHSIAQWHVEALALSMVRRFVPEKISVQLAGHKTRSVFDRYNVVSEGDLRLAAERLERLTGTKKGQLAENARDLRPEGSAKTCGFVRFGGAARI